MEVTLWPINLLDTTYSTYEQKYDVYRNQLIDLLKTKFKYDDLLFTYKAFVLFEKLAKRLYTVKRYANYQVADTGDMNVCTHTLRQTIITVEALLIDKDALKLSVQEIDYMITAALIHDFGELALTDISYDLKETSKKQREMAESDEAFKLMHSLEPDMLAQFKELYLYITTSLDADEVKNILLTLIPHNQPIRWNVLKELFSTYERYGYLITGFQIWPFGEEKEFKKLSDLDVMRLNEWNRAELEVALANREEVYEKIKNAIVYKNTMLNQWDIVRQASKNYPSASAFFDSRLVRERIEIGNKMLGLEIIM